MNDLLIIDTTTSPAFIILGSKDGIKSYQTNAQFNTHASFIHQAISEILNPTDFEKIAAIAVVAGPGSYTGIKIGVAAAQGLTMAWQKPLIYLNSLDLRRVRFQKLNPVVMDNIIMMQLARTAEFYWSTFKVKNQNDIQLQLITASELFAKKNKFTSDTKWLIDNETTKQELAKIIGEQFSLSQIQYNQHDLLFLSFEYFENRNFTNPNLAEPFYIKEVFIR